MENEIVKAVEIIKTAILNSQYEAAKDVNRVQLGLYFGIGRFLASKKGKKTWGTGVLETISENLRKQLPGLRGFSTTSLKKMRQFYENWSFLEAPNSSVATDELPESSKTEDKSIERNDFLHQKELPNNFVNTLSSAKQARKAVI